MKKRVAIVDDHVSIRQMLACILQREYEIVGEASTGPEALELCRRCSPEVVILDLALPELAGSEVTRRLRTEGSRARVLIYSGTVNRKQYVHALQCKPHGLVQKSDPLDVLREAVRVVATGGLYFTPFATDLWTEARHEEDSHLTDRERQVLQMVAESRSSKEIAAHLGLSVKTVENHRANIMEKLHLRDVAGLTRYAVQHGMIG